MKDDQRRKQSDAMREFWSDPELREAQSEAVSRHWASMTPEQREQHRAKVRAAWTPEKREAARQRARKVWACPERRKAALARREASTAPRREARLMRTIREAWSELSEDARKRLMSELVQG